MNIVSFGCDPEIFLKDASGNIKSAIGLFGGTKEKPKPLKTLGDGYAVQEDNVLMEFNIPPAPTPAVFVNSVQKTVDLLSKRAAMHGLSFANGSAYSLHPDELTHPRAKVFGCDPDFNAYTGEKNPPPKANDPCLRSAGGHIAVGFSCYQGVLTEYLKKNKKELDAFLVREMDMFLGIPSILIDDGLLRKQLYGKAGAFRPKSYGVEYRSLSNFWVFSPAFIKSMLENWNTFLQKEMGDYILRNIDIWVKTRRDIHEMTELAINTNDKEYAKWFLRRYNGWFSHSNIISLMKKENLL